MKAITSKYCKMKTCPVVLNSLLCAYMERLAKQWSMKEIGYSDRKLYLVNEMILNVNKFIASNEISELLNSSVIMFCHNSL